MTERDETLRVGDLVAIKKPTYCCNNDGSLGWIYEVTGVSYTGYSMKRCMFCNGLSPVDLSQCIGIGHTQAIERSRVVKLHPPTDEETKIFENELELVT